jgi:SAM-dependent methyltransferase
MLTHTANRIPVHRIALRCVVLVFAFACTIATASEFARTGGPFVPTPQAVVDAMLDVAKVGPQDFVIDLGSGDGRIVLTAAQRYKARGLGIDIDPALVKQSNAAAEQRGLSSSVSFREQDVLQAPVGEATVVTLYLLPGMMHELQSKFTKELRPGTRIVSHDFLFGEWKPDREVTIDIPEKYGTPGHWKSTIFYWVVPARVSGGWQITAPGLLAEPVALTVEQQYQFFQGTARENGIPTPVSGGRLEANRIRFGLSLDGGVCEFNGIVDGDRMRGEALMGGRSVGWTARRASSPGGAAR